MAEKRNRFARSLERVESHEPVHYERPEPVRQESTILDKLDPKPKKPAGKTRGFYLDVETIELLSTVSRKLGCNKSELVNHVLKETLKDFL